RQRLLVVDIKPGIGEAPRVERLDDRVGVDDRAARGVDEHRRRFHQPDLAPPNDAAAARAQHEVYREDVGAAEQLVLLDVLDTLRRRLLGGQVLAPRDRLHAKGEPDAGNRAAEAAEPKDAQRFAGDAVADAGLPAALAHQRM